jgi:Mn-containing catalase
VYLHTQLLINEILPDEPDPAAANALQEGLGGQFGNADDEQYLFQSINFRGDASSKPYKDLLQGVGTEEISHVELIGTTIARLLDGSAAYQGNKTDPLDEPAGKGGHAAQDRLGYQQHPPLPGWRAGRPAGRCGGKPVERLVCLQQRQPRARPALQPDVGSHRPATEMPDL